MQTWDLPEAEQHFSILAVSEVSEAGSPRSSLEGTRAAWGG